MRTFELENLGSIIAKYRNGINMTQHELAEKIGVSDPFMSNLERGIKRPKLDTLCSIAKVLDVSFDALLCDDSPDAHLTTINQLLSDKPLKYLMGVEEMIRTCNRCFFEEEPTSSETDETPQIDEARRD